MGPFKQKDCQSYVSAFLLTCSTTSKNTFSKTAEREKVGHTPVYHVQLRTFAPGPLFICRSTVSLHNCPHDRHTNPDSRRYRLMGSTQVTTNLPPQSHRPQTSAPGPIHRRYPGRHLSGRHSLYPRFAQLLQPFNFFDNPLTLNL